MRPVAQEERNTIETQLKHTQCVCESSQLSPEQIAYIRSKTKVPDEEIYKAVEILRVSKCDNIMKMLLTASFFEGKCILEPDRQEELSKEDREAAQRRKYLDKCSAETRSAIERARAGRSEYESESMTALKWYRDDLTDDQRQAVRDRIVARHPMAKTNIESGNFSPSILAFISVERRKVQTGEVTL